MPDFIVEEFEAYLRCGILDIMTCPRCRGAMRLVKIANKPDDIARVLAELGLGARPPAAKAGPAGQLKLDFAA